MEGGGDAYEPALNFPKPTVSLEETASDGLISEVN